MIKWTAKLEAGEEFEREGLADSVRAVLESETAKFKAELNEN